MYDNEQTDRPTDEQTDPDEQPPDELPTVDEDADDLTYSLDTSDSHFLRLIT